MDIENLLYILLAIAWIILKSRSAAKEQQAKRPAPAPVKVPVPEDDKPARPGRVRQVKEVKQRPSLQRKRDEIQFDSGRSLEVIKSDIHEKPVPVSEVLNIRADTKFPDQADSESDGSRLGREIREGNIDWRRAVIINELLRNPYRQ